MTDNSTKVTCGKCGHTIIFPSPAEDMPIEITCVCGEKQKFKLGELKWEPAK